MPLSAEQPLPAFSDTLTYKGELTTLISIIVHPSPDLQKTYGVKCRAGTLRLFSLRPKTFFLHSPSIMLSRKAFMVLARRGLIK